MKKKLLLLLALVLALALFGTALVGCKDKGPSDEILSKLLNDVDRYYRNESEVTNSNYGVLSSISTQTDDGEVEVKISWKASSDKISIASKVNAQNMYLVTIPDRSTLTADLSYTLTATLVDEGGKAYEDADGKTYSVSFNRKVNAIGSLYAKMEFKDENNRTYNADKTTATWVEGDITFVNNKANSSTALNDNVNPIRIYVGSTVTISYPQPFKVISLDVNTFYVNSLDGVTLEGATVARANKTVVITLDQPATEFTFSITKQLRLHSLEIYREGAPELADLPEIDTTTYGDTEAEILAALQQLPEGSTLSGGQKQYTLTGTIESIDTAYDSQYNQITVTIKVGEVSIQCFQMKAYENRAVGDVIKVTGTLTNYAGKYEFDVGCTYELISSAGGEETTTYGIVPAETILEGDYYLGLYNGKAKKWYFFTGVMGGYNNYYFATSDNHENAAQVTLEAHDNGFYIKVKSSNQYLTLGPRGTDYTNSSLSLSATAQTVWTWNTEHNVFTTTLSNGGVTTTFYLANYDTHTDLSGCNQWSDNTWPGTIGTIDLVSTEEPEPEPEPELPEASLLATLNTKGTSTRTSYSKTQIVHTGNGVTYTNDKGSSTSNCYEITNENYETRAYAHSNITISYTSAFKYIVLTCYSNNATLGDQEFDGMTIIEDSTAHTITIVLDEAANTVTLTDLSAQVRIGSIAVYG